MKILITAGNTQTPIDRVRSISNIFTGKTGTLIALEAWRRDHEVTLFTSHPELLGELVPDFRPATDRGEVQAYRTFDELHALMAAAIPGGGFDAIIHCAAVSDYSVEGAYAPAAERPFVREQGTGPLEPVLAGKVPSSHRELWLRLVPTPKLVDSVRSPWGFRGVLVKFKLEVERGPEELVTIGRASRLQSDADLLVANALESMHRLAYLIDREGGAEEVVRMSLPRKLIDRVEALRVRS